ncbi:hypothetical protein EST38_g10636 [Candolleomyces aberdarensis]|uniref:Nephrocystin 3-like N-terminal domain-containing protein n=1 Tax=Candolleomyces aberdarensis TaxID=2316362 RepID=A0A4Q2D9S5_9AGAR|nr:hypothetical protein EST38_g10636 [Candolleomyces aberdarensis]
MVKFAVTLASQMAAVIPETVPFIEAALTSEPGLLKPGTLSLEFQLQSLVFEPFKAAADSSSPLSSLPGSTSPTPLPFLIVIDGLDECEDKEGTETFIDSTLKFFEANPTIPLRFFITTRIEQHIQDRLEVPKVILDNLDRHGSEHDIEIFVEAEFQREAKRHCIIRAYIEQHGYWPTADHRRQLISHIRGSFIFASTLIKYILRNKGDGLTAMDRLPLALDMNPGLDGLYMQTLARVEHLPHFMDVISTITLAVSAFSISKLAQLLRIKTFKVLHVLVDLQSIIQDFAYDVPEISMSPITLLWVFGRITSAYQQLLPLDDGNPRLCISIKEEGSHFLNFIISGRIEKVNDSTQALNSVLQETPISTFADITSLEPKKEDFSITISKTRN